MAPRPCLGAWLLARTCAQQILFGPILETPGAGAAPDESEDAGAALFSLILGQDVTRLCQVFPAMVKFLECAEREVPHGCQPAVRGTRLSADHDHYLTVGGKINKNKYK